MPKIQNFFVKKPFLVSLFVCFFVSLNCFAATTEWQIDEVSGAKTRFLASSIIENDQRIIISGVEFELQDGWKIYGKDSEEIGMPSSIDFQGSKNYKQHQIEWPKAHEAEEKIGDATYRYQYYKQKVVLPVRIELVDQKQKVAELVLNLNFGICKDVCVPVSKQFRLTVDDQVECEAVKIIRQFQADSGSKAEQEFNQIDLSLDGASKNVNQKGLALMLLIALIGGAILNIMPCVLPVLSFKLIGILKHSHQKIAEIRLAFASTIAGIVCCFVVLAMITYSLKLAGNALGWGFQFQNPIFLIFLIQILAFFVADLMGFFEINFGNFTGFVANFINKKIAKSSSKSGVKSNVFGKIFLPNFFSGILAVMLATPCSAPFLGSAISFALTKNLAVILLIFVAIGCGFALPYFVLLISPKLLKLLPKPGNWMLKTKQLMAGFLVATMIWLVWVLSSIIGFLPAMIVALFSVLLFLAMKLKSLKSRMIALLLILALVFTIPFKIHQNEIKSEQRFAKYWQAFDENILAALVAQNRVVLVDVTADWCITCKFNKLLVLKSDEVVSKLESGEIIGLRADITRPDPEVMKFLKKHERYAIPFNAVYGPNLLNGQATSELLDKKELLELIEKAK